MDDTEKLAIQRILADLRYISSEKAEKIRRQPKFSKDNTTVPPRGVPVSYTHLTLPTSDLV